MQEITSKIICLPFYITADAVINNIRNDPLNQFCS